MKKKGLAVAVILLFIGVAFAPSINAKMNNDPVPDLDCEGGLAWSGEDLEPGDVLTGCFAVGNIGEPNSELDWRIMSCPFWGTWTFDPESGTGLTPEDGFLTVVVELILEVEINETLWGEIGIQNVDNESDICYIDMQIKKKSIDEIVEFDVEFSGLGKKHTVKLTQEEADEVERLFDDIKEQLDAVETRKETEEIFKGAVVELDKYGLLGGLSVRQAKQIVTENYENHKLMRLLKTIYQKYKGTIDENRNLLCFIVGATNGTNFDSQLELLCGRILFLLSFMGPIFFNSRFPLYTIFILGYFLLDFFNSFNPMAVASRINLGGEMGGGWHPEFVDFYAHGWIVTTGLLGTQRYEGMMQGGLPLYGSGTISNGYIYAFSPGVLGFTGLHIYNPIQAKHFYLGSALWVNFEEV